MDIYLKWAYVRYIMLNTVITWAYASLYACSLQETAFLINLLPHPYVTGWVFYLTIGCHSKRTCYFLLPLYHPQLCIFYTLFTNV